MPAARAKAREQVRAIPAETPESRIRHRYNFIRQRFPMIPEDEALMIAEGLEDHHKGKT